MPFLIFQSTVLPIYQCARSAALPHGGWRRFFFVRRGHPEWAAALGAPAQGRLTSMRVSARGRAKENR